MAAPLPDIYIERARMLRGGDPASTARLLAGLDAGVRRLGAAAPLVALAIDVEADRNRPGAALEWLNRLPQNLRAIPKWQARRGDLLMAADRRPEARAAYRAALARLRAMARRQSRANRTLEARLQGLVATLP